MLPRTKLNNIYITITPPSPEEGKNHNVWHLLKNYQVCKEGNFNALGEDKKQSIESNIEMTWMIKLVDRGHKNILYVLNY